VNVDGGTAIRLETQTHAVGIIQPPPDIRAIVDKTAQFVARNGPDFEKRILGSEKNNQKFNFLLPTDPYNAYYQSKIAAFKEEAAGGDAAAVQAKAEEAAKAAAEKSGIAVVAGTGSARAKVLQAPAKAEYSVDVPPGITSLDLDVIKLTAQFVARNGKTFLTGLTSREHSNPQFNFLKPTHSMFGFFTSLADAYSKVLMPPKGLSEQLKKDEDKSALLERALQRLEWDRTQEAAKKQEDDELEREREAMAMIDWHDFVVVETIDFFDEEDEELPMPLTLRDVVTQLRDADAETEADGAAAGTAEEDDAAADVEMDEDEKDMIREGVAAGAAPSGVSGPEPSMKIVRNYKKPEQIAAEAKAKASGGVDATKFAVSPITGELIAVDQMAEHMRISLIDPKWKVQKDAMLAKLKDSTMANDEEVATNVLMLARTRPDIFGTTDEEVSTAIKESIESKKKLGSGAGATTETAGGGGLPSAPIPPPPPPARTAVPAPPAAPIMPPAVPPPPVMVPPPPTAAGPALKPAPAVPMPPPVSTLRPLGPGIAAPPPPVAAPVAPPAPPPVAPPEDDDEPGTKKRKVGEMELDSEEDFLAANGGSGVIKVTFPSVDGDDNLNGQTVDLNVDSLSTPVSELKKLIKEAAGGLAANKQKISVPGLGFFTDKNSLAYYNIKYGTTLQLSLKERGGRKK
jgi:splicing factor 3A subunit 1